MKAITFLFLFFLVIKSFSQDYRTSAAVIVDGKVALSDKIDSNEVLERSVIKGETLNQIYSNKKLDSIVVIITKQFAISQYQKKLGLFSKEYKDYVEWQMTYNHNDNSIFYVVLKNGDPILFSRDELTRELFNIPVTNIVKVELNRKETCCGTNISGIITTKK